MAVRLVVFARSPVVGQVKTRLARSVGDARALEVHLQLLAQTLRCARDSKLERELWVAGACDQPELSKLAGCYGIPVVSQPPGDLGQRMQAAFEGRGAEQPLLLVGSDCPELRPDHLAQAAAWLAGPADLVLGPAADGGYYLVGLRQPCAALFTGVAWGSSTVLATTLHIARDLGLDVQLLERLRDIDVESDLDWATSRGLLR